MTVWPVELFLHGIGPRDARWLPEGMPGCGCLSPATRAGSTFTCTRHAGHRGDHAAHTGPRVMVARWTSVAAPDRCDHGKSMLALYRFRYATGLCVSPIRHPAVDGYVWCDEPWLHDGPHRTYTVSATGELVPIVWARHVSGRNPQGGNAA